MDPRDGTDGQRHSSCLWFQIVGVEAGSFLPDGQSNDGDLARQGQTRHLWFDPLGHQRIVKLLERSGLGSSDGRSALVEILQIVVVIAIHPANRHLLLRALELSIDTTVLGTTVCVDSKTNVGL